MFKEVTMKKLVLQAIACILIGVIVTGIFTFFIDAYEKRALENGGESEKNPAYEKIDMPIGYNIAESASFAGGAVMVLMGLTSLGTHLTRSFMLNNKGNAVDIAVVYKNNPKGLAEHVKSPERVYSEEGSKAYKIAERALPFVIGLIFIIAGTIGVMQY